MKYIKQRVYEVTKSYLEETYEIEPADIGSVLDNIGSTHKEYTVTSEDVGKILLNTEADSGEISRGFQFTKTSLRK